MSGNTILLRQWQDEDLEPYAAMNADAVVMEYYPRLLTIAQSAESLARQRASIATRGWGLWVVEADGVFAGYTGLAVPAFTAHFTPCVEIGWRLRREFWGRGIAFAAATAAQTYAFAHLQLGELVSFTSAINLRSRRLMERLGFARRASDDFLHPSIDSGSPLCRHVLYRKPNLASGSTPPALPVAGKQARAPVAVIIPS